MMSSRLRSSLATAMLLACVQPISIEMSSGDEFGETEEAIVGGWDASVYDYPYLASVQTKAGVHLCAATILNRRWLATTARCITRTDSTKVAVSDLRVVAGVSALSDASYYGQIRSVTELVVHPYYSNASFAYDYGLIGLSSDLNLYDSRVEAIGVATNVDEWEGVAAPGDIATVIGWGSTYDGGAASNILKRADMPIISNLAADVFDVPIDRTHIAVKDAGQGLCQKDGGSPLIAFTGPRAPNDDTCRWANDGACDDGGSGSTFSVCAFGTDYADCGYRYTTANPILVGAGSFFARGCDTDFPSVFARMSGFAPLIASTIPYTPEFQDDTPLDDHPQDIEGLDVGDRLYEDGAALAGRFETPGDVDYFVFRAEAQRKYTVFTKGLVNGNTTLRVENGSLSAVATDTGHGNEPGASMVTFKAPVTGDYYIRVAEGFDPGASYLVQVWEQYLTNPWFTLGSTGWAGVNGITVRTAPLSAAGNTSIAITFGDKIRQFSQLVRPFPPEKEFTLSYRMNKAQATGNARVRIIWKQDTVVIARTTVGGIYCSKADTQGWQTCEDNVTAPPGADSASVRVQALKNGSGTVYFDAVTLRDH